MSLVKLWKVRQSKVWRNSFRTRSSQSSSFMNLAPCLEIWACLCGKQHSCHRNSSHVLHRSFEDVRCVWVLTSERRYVLQVTVLIRILQLALQPYTRHATRAQSLKRTATWYTNNVVPLRKRTTQTYYRSAKSSIEIFKSFGCLTTFLFSLDPSIVSLVQI